MSSSLSVSGLVKRFGKKTAIDDLSFAVASGEIVALLGPNGAGKSTTFACLAGLARPDAGTIRFDGRLLESDRGRTVAVIPETPDVYPLLTHLLGIHPQPNDGDYTAVAGMLRVEAH